MPLSLLQLDNAYPPIWLRDYSSGKTLQGLPVAVGGQLNPSLTPVADANSSLRKTNGEDYNNYYVRQRVEGDLFHRDNLITDFLKNLDNYLGQRAGLVFSVPNTLLVPNSSVRVAQVGDIQNSSLSYTGLYVSAANCNKQVDSGSCGIRIVGTVASVQQVLYNAPVSTNMFTTGALSASSRGYQIVNATNVFVEVYNASLSSNAKLSGFVVLSPNTV